MITIVKNLYNFLYNKYYTEGAKGTFGDDDYTEGTFDAKGTFDNDDYTEGTFDNDEFMIDGLELILLKVINY